LGVERSQPKSRDPHPDALRAPTLPARGRVTTERVASAGARTVHDAKAGATGAKVIVTYVVEKGKPLASPAP
jgi:hypothetical protein